jgi:NAD(P)-dependent dehydrogenase (short-subunit alcohol dehydrogenase family)
LIFEMNIQDLFSVKNKVVLVTGGATGIGRMAVEALASGGAKVYLASRKLEACQAVADELNQILSGVGHCYALRADLSNEAGVLELSEAFKKREQHLDILINNAGKSWGASLEEFPWKAWDDVMSVNVSSIFTLTRELLPCLQAGATSENPARVINLGSVMGIQATKITAYSYAASKAAVHHLTRILSNELASKNIAVNAIAPGPFASRMMAHITDDKEAADEMAAGIPLARLGRPEDVAGLVLYLSSPASSYVTGAIIPLDGGIVARG